MSKLDWVDIIGDIIAAVTAVFLVANGWQLVAEYGLGWRVSFGNSIWATIGVFAIHWGWVTWKRIVL